MLRRLINPCSLYEGTTRVESDFLQGLTMKIRFLKKVPVDDINDKEGKLVFNPCDQVQIKITQLELNNIRLFSNSEAIGKI